MPEAGVRLYRCRLGLGRLGSGQPAFGKTRSQGVAARGRRLGQIAVCAHAGRHRQALGPRFGWAVRDGAASGDERPAHVLAARPASRRIELGQRHGLYARAGGRLRSLAAARQCRLELCRCAAILQESRTQRTPARRIPWRRWAAQRRRAALHQSAEPRLRRGGAAGGDSVQSRFQRRRAARLRAVSGDAEKR